LFCKHSSIASITAFYDSDALKKKVYSGPKNPRTGKQISPGLEPGSENGWNFFAGGPGPGPPIVASHFKYLVFQNPSWNYRSLNFDGDLALADN